MTKKKAPPAARYVYAITRDDLPAAHQAVQVGHALIAATIAFSTPGAIAPHPHLIVCSVPDEAALVELFESLKKQNVPCCCYREDDMADAMTAVATGMLHGEERRPLRRLPLLKS